MRKFNKKKLSCFIGAVLCVFCLNITSFAATHTYDSADFSVSASSGGWDEHATLETHGYEVKTAEILLNDVAFNGGLDISDKTLVISGSVNIDTLSTNDPYSSSSSINIKGNGVLTVSNLMAGCGSLNILGSDGLEVNISHLNNHNTGGTGICYIKDLSKGSIDDVSWTSLDGLALVNSHIVLGEHGSVFVEKINSDTSSIIHLKSSINNYGNTTDGLDSLNSMIPYGYQIIYNEHSLNSLYDKDGNLVDDLLLKYRPFYSVEISAYPSDSGSALSDLNVAKDGSSIHLTATASNASYEFDHWEYNGKNISTSQIFDFYVEDPTGDISIKAIFKLNDINEDGNSNPGDLDNEIDSGIVFMPKISGSYSGNYSEKRKYELKSDYQKDSMKNKEGWFLENGNWYYRTLKDGLKSGWHFEKEDNCWYYLDPISNKMLTGWQNINNKWYYFNESTPTQTWFYNTNSKSWHYESGRPLGSMFLNETTPDGYFINHNGEWIN